LILKINDIYQYNIYFFLCSFKSKKGGNQLNLFSHIFNSSSIFCNSGSAATFALGAGAVTFCAADGTCVAGTEENYCLFYLH